MQLIATAAFGLEAVVARELEALGLTDRTVENGRVLFRGGPEALPRANLWLRSADRVLLHMGSFEARTFDQLFEGTRALRWEEWLPEDAEFPVSGKSVRSRLFSVPDCQAIVKKAVADAMRRRYHRQWFPETGPRYAIEVALLKDVATLTIDTSGAGLHRRGYRPLAGAAPLRETLAAAMVQLSYWRPDRLLVDPFCGSGTIPIEAALIAGDIAPGLRRRFAAEDWPAIPAQLWRSAREEARQRAAEGARVLRELRIEGSDVEEEALRLARHHARLAGVESAITFRRRAVAEFPRSEAASEAYGCLVCNPPYGERLGDRREAERIYRQMREAFSGLDTWSLYVLTAHERFERLFGRRADRKRKLYNARIEVTYYQFLGPPPRPRLPAPQGGSNIALYD